MSEELPEIAVDTANLYREEHFTDRKVGTLTQLTPVTVQGELDTSRNVLYVGQSQLYTPAGMLPISAEIEAASLEEAIEKFPAAMRESVEATMEELKEMRRQAASQLVVPGQESGGMGGMGGMPGGGMPGGGKIQMP